MKYIVTNEYKDIKTCVSFEYAMHRARMLSKHNPDNLVYVDSFDGVWRSSLAIFKNGVVVWN